MQCVGSSVLAACIFFWVDHWSIFCEWVCYHTFVLHQDSSTPSFLPFSSYRGCSYVTQWWEEHIIIKSHCSSSCSNVIWSTPVNSVSTSASEPSVASLTLHRSKLFTHRFKSHWCTVVSLWWPLWFGKQVCMLQQIWVSPSRSCCSGTWSTSGSSCGRMVPGTQRFLWIS